MNRILFLLLGALLALSLQAQTPEPYDFKEFKMLPATPVKSQDRTGTCWSFSTTSFLESEALRRGKGEHNLSEMFTVRHIYRDKCENYVRRMGKAQLSEGGLAHDKLNVVRKYGVVPESVYPGRKDPNKPFNHSQLEQSLQKLCDGFVEAAKKGELPENWLERIDDVLDAEFGTLPIKFTYNNIQFTPSSFRSFLGIDPDDYVNITSFSHHPFWTSFILEVPDNFSNGSFYNMPLSDLMRCLNLALQKGYTVEWDADVSNPGFNRQEGLALAPEADWSSKTREQIANTFRYWEPEKTITQDYRQKAFDRLETQDDHLMHITGLLNEGQGGTFYAVKNSWGTDSGREGYVYVSEAYMRLNTISFTLHKDALPPDIRQRMGFEPAKTEAEMHTPDAGGAATPGDARAQPSNSSQRQMSKLKLKQVEMETIPGPKAPRSDN